MSVLTQALDIATSDLAILLYAWGLVLGAALGSIFASFMMRGALRDFAPNDLYQRKRGRPCITKKCRIREADRLKSVRQNKALSVFRSLLILIALGAVIPGICLAILVIFQPFFMPDAPPALTAEAVPVAPGNVELWSLFMFLFGNSLWGAAVEINTGLPLTGVSLESGRYALNPDNLLFANLATAYKFWTAPLMGLVALTITRAVTGWKLVDERLKSYG